jgi:hypothetical protein
MRPFVIFGLLCCTMFFSHYLTNGTISENVIELKMLLFSLQSLLKTFLVLIRNERDMIKRNIGLYVKHH